MSDDVVRFSVGSRFLNGYSIYTNTNLNYVLNHHSDVILGTVVVTYCVLNVWTYKHHAPVKDQLCTLSTDPRSTDSSWRKHRTCVDWSTRDTDGHRVQHGPGFHEIVSVDLRHTMHNINRTLVVRLFLVVNLTTSFCDATVQTYYGYKKLAQLTLFN